MSTEETQEAVRDVGTIAKTKLYNARTRAEIQAEIENVIRKAFDAGRTCAVFEANPCPITREYHIETQYDLAKAQSALGVAIDSYAADLIPRAEHEAALREARKISTRDAATILLDSYKADGYQYPHSYIDDTYRVTVERVDDKYDDDALKKPPRPDQAAANALAEWYAANNREHKTTWSHEVNGRTYFICVAPHDGTGYAPDPQPTAVAPKGVVEELAELAGILEHYDRRQWSIPLRRALSRITELPEPSEWARIYINTNYRLKRSTTDERRDLAAALLERAKETE